MTKTVYTAEYIEGPNKGKTIDIPFEYVERDDTAWKALIWACLPVALIILITVLAFA